ncbi:amino acid ABC transporter substrate-binding protein [Aliidongia dinghuensis]|uniref:Amino acid ABC transporter substrate-binding protein n=1 Tax=Aliidongia dinghuensis TaxID=1867774 RepID=A0A8J2YXD6_9PROT|nr:amino acid ABC transporter substrate-binding protein [Aliidongia dinghuensis]GGF28394.1 amino acid ABC transporter substrate-binding protein [Aliidongia dinghuensis]
MRKLLGGAILALATVGIFAAAEPAAAGTLDAVRQRGELKCGVNTGLPGFSFLDSQGKWRGLDIDMCGAVAAAVLGDAGKASYTPLTAATRFTALQTGEIDMLVRNSTITLQRDTQLGLQYAGINFYDGQAVAVTKAAKVTKMEELKGTTICIAQGTTHELTLADWFRGHKLDYKPVVFENQDRMYEAFFAGRCDAMTQDASALAAAITSVSGHPDDYMILPERISKEPLGPFVRHGDDQWLDVVRWTLMAMIEAEELGVTQTNVDEKLKDADPRIQRLLGVSEGNGKALGLDEKWAYNVVKQIGNYGDSYERNVGKASALKLDRGPNGLWTAGGLMYAIPLR